MLMKLTPDGDREKKWNFELEKWAKKNERKKSLSRFDHKHSSSSKAESEGGWTNSHLKGGKA